MKKKEEECENPAQPGSLLEKKETKSGRRYTVEGNYCNCLCYPPSSDMRLELMKKKFLEMWGEKRSESVPVPHAAIFIPIFLN
jgi:hypothetical protein